MSRETDSQPASVSAFAPGSRAEGPQPSPRRVASGLEGRLEAVLDGHVIGWAWNPGRQSERVKVRVLIDGASIVDGFADLERRGLAEAGIGDGIHGFNFVLPTELADGLAHSIEVLVGVEEMPLQPSSEFISSTQIVDHPFAGTRFASMTQGALPNGSSSQRGLVGKEGWLFLCGDSNLTLAQLAGIRVLSAEDIEMHVDAVVERQRWLAELGVPYLLGVVPMKERVYAELLPDGLPFRPARRVPDQLAAALRDIDGCELFDLLPSLSHARRHGSVYHRTDTHWNDRGAFFGTRALLKEAAKHIPVLRPPSLTEMHLIPRIGFRGDLADKPKVAFVGKNFIECVDDGDWAEDVDVVDQRKLRARHRPAEPHLHVSATRPPKVFEIPGAENLPSCVLVGDSFCLMLLPWLAERFRRLAFMWTPEPPREAIEIERPDVLLHVKAERFLIARPGSLPGRSVR